jgi:succinate dehydrogenase / fumarate reductase, flavoprotein subunit
MQEYGKHPAQRACAAADRIGHALLHTLYQQCLNHKVEFYVEYFVLDLIMDGDTCLASPGASRTARSIASTRM